MSSHSGARLVTRDLARKASRQIPDRKCDGEVGVWAYCATRRRLLVVTGAGLLAPPARILAAEPVDMRRFGAIGDGPCIDSPAINRVIDAAAENGGGAVRVSAGLYAGHNHWHNSLIRGANPHDMAILGPGHPSGPGLNRSCDFESDLPRAEAPGVANKAVALKNCHNVILRDFAILKGGHFAILATEVDNPVIDGLRFDTDRDGMDIDCCGNVAVSNRIVNYPGTTGSASRVPMGLVLRA